MKNIVYTGFGAGLLALSVLAGCQSQGGDDNKPTVSNSERRNTSSIPSNMQSIDQATQRTTDPGEQLVADAQQSGASMSPNAAVSPHDRQFILSAASSGSFEVQSSQLALQKTQDAQVRSFAQHMIDDHSKSNAELQTLAAAKGVAIPSDLMPAQQQLLDELKNLDGKQFDQRYMQIQQQAHQQTVSLFEKGGNNVTDNELEQFVQKTLPTLNQHLEQTQHLNHGAVNQ